MRTLLEDLAKIDKALEIELLELTRDLMPIQVAQVLAEELGLKGLNQKFCIRESWACTEQGNLRWAEKEKTRE